MLQLDIFVGQVTIDVEIIPFLKLVCKILQLKLDDVDINEHRTCKISYDNHVKVNNMTFPLNREIAIEGKSKLIIHMEFKEFGFNEPLKYTFAIPRPGKRR